MNLFSWAKTLGITRPSSRVRPIFFLCRLPLSTTKKWRLLPTDTWNWADSTDFGGERLIRLQTASIGGDGAAERVGEQRDDVHEQDSQWLAQWSSTIPAVDNWT